MICPNCNAKHRSTYEKVLCKECWERQSKWQTGIRVKSGQKQGRMPKQS